jgi:CheY-like chemotaxis protein
VGERELIDAVGVALGLSKRPAEFTLEPAVLPMPAVRVLLVDDNEVNREVVAEMLRRLGHQTTLAPDGEQALAILGRSTFDIIFMDVQLPGMDGLEVTRRFRASGGTTPVIALTAHSSRQDRDRCLAAGMTSVLTKPVDAAHLAEAIETAPRRESIAEIVGGNPALLARVRDAFSRQTPELLESIRDSRRRNDGESLARHAHKLKGSLSYFPGTAASIARDIETAAKAGNLDRVDVLIPELERKVAQLSAELAAV